MDQLFWFFAGVAVTTATWVISSIFSKKNNDQPISFEDYKSWRMQQNMHMVQERHPDLQAMDKDWRGAPNYEEDHHG